MPENPKRRITLAQVSVIVTIVATVVTTGFVVADRLDGSEPAAPKVLGADLSNLRVTPSVLLRDHLAGTRRLDRFRRNSAESGIPKAAVAAVLATPGVEVAYDLRIEGPPGRTVRVAATTFREGSGRPIRSTGLEQRTSYVSEAESDKLAGRVWVPAPSRPGRYVTRVDVLGPREETLASATTRAFELP